MSADGFPIPEVDFVVTFTGGARATGTLDRSGTATLQGVPMDAFHVDYLDRDTIRARAMAARLNAALAANDLVGVRGVLAQSAPQLAAIRDAFSTYFGGDMAADARACAGSSDEDLMSVDYLLTAGGVDATPGSQVIVRREDDPGGNAVA
ncbi:MAG: hypothetical protein ACRENE_23480 [Polyangiaceae bacterium]